jgi:membrane fusion protein, multidrug efflux system
MNARLVFPAVALALAVAACGSGEAAPPSARTPPPPSRRLQLESLTTVVPIDGTVAARRRAEIATRLMARVTSVTVNAGAVVHAGQPLVRLGEEDVAAGRSRAVAARDAARAGRDEAARQAARMDTLLTQDAVARVQRDQAHVALAQAESQLAMAEASLRDATIAASYATLAAPFAGVVASRTVDPGDLATPGVPLVVVEDDGPRDAVFAVPAELAADLRLGSAIPVEGPDGRRVAAPVRVIAHAADPVTRTVEVRVTVPQAWPTGVAVTALVPAGIHQGITVPADAIVRRGQLTGVRVVMDDAVVLRWVRVGRTIASPRGEPDSARVEVLSGLEPGDRIVP